jgi:glycosyltransferase involved in cell wall biosynthesis
MRPLLRRREALPLLESISSATAHGVTLSGDFDINGAVRPLLSIIVPVFNEARTLEEVVRRLQSLRMDKEILIVDDGSLDSTSELVSLCSELPDVRTLAHKRNLGKGAAVRTALTKVRGHIIVIQDADLEYDPAEIELLTEPICNGSADVCFGSRFLLESRASCPAFGRLINKLLTRLSNCMTGLRLTDMHTCYKAMRREVMAGIRLRESRFGIDPELAAKIARGKWRVCEVPISYNARSYAAGKKIGFLDGLRAVWCIFRYSVWD